MLSRLDRVLCKFGLVSSMLLSFALAQTPPASPPLEPPQRGKSQSPESARWRIFDMFRRNGAAPELLMLLVDSKVQSDLKIDQEMPAKLESLRKDFEAQLEQIRTVPPSNSRENSPFKKLVEGASRNAEKFLTEELTAEQYKRLLGIFIQVRGYRGLSNKLLAKEVGIEGDKANELRESIDRFRSEMIEKSSDRVRELFQNGSGPAEFETLMKENQRAVDEQVKKILTAEQLAKFEELRAKDFEVPSSWITRGVPGGPGDRTGDDRRPPPRPPQGRDGRSEHDEKHHGERKRKPDDK